MQPAQIQPAIVSISPAPERIGSAPESGVLVIQAEDALFMIDADGLAAPRDQDSAIELGRHPRSRRIAAALSGAWSINPITRTLAFIDDQRPATVPLDGAARPSPIPGRGLKGIPEGLVVDDSGIALVSVSRANGDPDFDTLDLCCLDVKTGKVLAERVLSTVGRLQIVWSAAARSFFALDFNAERLWRISTKGEKTEVLYPGQGQDFSLSELSGHPRGSPLAIRLQAAAADNWQLVQAVPDDKALRWEAPVNREDEVCERIVWHPRLLRFACERRTGKRSTLAIFDSRGALLREHVLPDNWIVRDLAWSGDGRLVYVAIEEGIASLEMK